MRFLAAIFISFHFIATCFAASGDTADWLPSQGRPGGYVTSETCKSCHKDEYDSWHRSFHRTMTQYAEETAVKADFNNVKLHFRGETFTLEKQFGQYWAKISEDGPAQKGSDEKDQPLRLPIGMVTGFH